MVGGVYEESNSANPWLQPTKILRLGAEDDFMRLAVWLIEIMHSVAHQPGKDCNGDDLVESNIERSG